MVGFTLMLFIYWGWDTSVSVNEETKDSHRTPGRAAVLSTLILLVTYALVVMASQSYAGIGTKGIGLGNPANSERRDQRARDFGLRDVGDRMVHDQAAAAHGAQLGGGVDADHHPAHGPDHAVDGDLQGDPRRRSDGCTSAS